MNDKMTKIGSACGIAGLVLASVLGISMATCCKGTKVAVLDVEKVRADAQAYQTVSQEAEKYISALKARTLEEDKVIQEEAIALKKKIDASSTGVKGFQKELNALNQKVAVLRQKAQFQSQLIARATQTALAQITPATQEALEDYTAQNGIAVLLPKSVLTYFNPDVDVTADFVKALNAKNITVSYPDPAQFTQNTQEKPAQTADSEKTQTTDK